MPSSRPHRQAAACAPAAAAAHRGVPHSVAACRSAAAAGAASQAGQQERVQKLCPASAAGHLQVRHVCVRRAHVTSSWSSWQHVMSISALSQVLQLHACPDLQVLDQLRTVTPRKKPAAPAAKQSAADEAPRAASTRGWPAPPAPACALAAPAAQGPLLPSPSSHAALLQPATVRQLLPQRPHSALPSGSHASEWQSCFAAPAVLLPAR